MAELTSSPRRRWRHFSLRMLLLFVAAIALPLGWKMNRVHNSRIAVAEVQRLDGFVMYDWETPEDPFSDSASPGPSWLKRVLGDDFFAEIVDVRILDTEVKYDGNSPLREDAKANSRTIEILSRLPSLKQLSLKSNGVNDEGMAFVPRLKQLESIEIGSKKITNVGLTQVATLSQLRYLSLRELSNVSAEGMAPLPALKRLSNLELSGPEVDDAWLVHVARMGQLEYLTLSETRVTDVGLSSIAKLSNLESLYIDGADITDSGLIHLVGMAHLRYFALENTQVTPEGVKRLRTALPACSIEAK